MTAMAGPAHLPPPQDLEHAVDVLRLLADRTRLAILALLADGEISVSDIAEALGRPGTVISQHLAKLRAGGLVTPRREGTTIYYSQPDEHVAKLVRNILQHSEHALYSDPPHPRPDR